MVNHNILTYDNGFLTDTASDRSSLRTVITTLLLLRLIIKTFLMGDSSKSSARVNSFNPHTNFMEAVRRLPFPGYRRGN